MLKCLYKTKHYKICSSSNKDLEPLSELACKAGLCEERYKKNWQEAAKHSLLIITAKDIETKALIGMVIIFRRNYNSGWLSDLCKLPEVKNNQNYRGLNSALLYCSFKIASEFFSFDYLHGFPISGNVLNIYLYNGAINWPNGGVIFPVKLLTQFEINSFPFTSKICLKSKKIESYNLNRILLTEKCPKDIIEIKLVESCYSKSKFFIYNKFLKHSNSWINFSTIKDDERDLLFPLVSFPKITSAINKNELFAKDKNNNIIFLKIINKFDKILIEFSFVENNKLPFRFELNSNKLFFDNVMIFNNFSNESLIKNFGSYHSYILTSESKNSKSFKIIIYKKC